MRQGAGTGHDGAFVPLCLAPLSGGDARSVVGVVGCGHSGEHAFGCGHSGGHVRVRCQAGGRPVVM